MAGTWLDAPHRPVDDVLVGVGEAAKGRDLPPGQRPSVLVLHTGDGAQVVASHRPLLPRSVGYGWGLLGPPGPLAPCPMLPVIGPGSWGAGFGLYELVLLKGLVPGDRQVAVVVFTVTAASQLEPGRALVDRPAAFGRD